MDWIMQGWPWYVAGPLIALIMFLLLYFGKSFGFSSNMRTIVSMCGGGQNCEFFRFNWKAQKWNLVFLVGAIFGGFIANEWLTASQEVGISAKSIARLTDMGIVNAGLAYVPAEIFSPEVLKTAMGWILLLGGGFLVGFGSRYAGGCTSGHAISGISNLQIPSVLAVIGFFIGGLIMTHFIIPHLF